MNQTQTRSIILIGIFLACLPFLIDGQSCDSSQFVIKNKDNGQNLLVIDSDKVTTCGGIEICSAIKEGAPQSLALDNNGQLSISNGNAVQLPDASDTNELQSLSISGSKISLSNNGGSVDLPNASPTNEIQSLSISSAKISLSNNGGSVDLPDADSTNELQTLSVTDGSMLSISNRNTVKIDPSWTKAWTGPKFDTMSLQSSVWITLEDYVVPFTVTSNTTSYLLSTNVRFSFSPTLYGCALAFIVADELDNHVVYVDFYNTDWNPVTSIMTAQAIVVFGLAPGNYRAAVQIVVNPATTLTFGTQQARLTVTKLSDTLTTL